MVPTVEFPPLTPFTAQITVWFVALLTFPAKVCDPPARTLALVGLIVIVTGGFGGGVVGGLGLLGEVPAQPASIRIMTTIKANEHDARFKISPVVSYESPNERADFVTPSSRRRAVANHWTKVQVKANGEAFWAQDSWYVQTPKRTTGCLIGTR